MSGGLQTHITIFIERRDSLQDDLERAEHLCVLIRTPEQCALAGSLDGWYVAAEMQHCPYLHQYVPLNASAGSISPPASLVFLTDGEKKDPHE